jgi:hypothetical protein
MSAQIAFAWRSSNQAPFCAARKNRPLSRRQEADTACNRIAARMTRAGFPGRAPLMARKQARRLQGLDRGPARPRAASNRANTTHPLQDSLERLRNYRAPPGVRTRFQRWQQRPRWRRPAAQVSEDDPAASARRHRPAAALRHNAASVWRRHCTPPSAALGAARVIDTRVRRVGSVGATRRAAVVHTPVHASLSFALSPCNRGAPGAGRHAPELPRSGRPQDRRQRAAGAGRKRPLAPTPLRAGQTRKAAPDHAD